MKLRTIAALAAATLGVFTAALPASAFPNYAQNLMTTTTGPKVWAEIGGGLNSHCRLNAFIGGSEQPGIPATTDEADLSVVSGETSTCTRVGAVIEWADGSIVSQGTSPAYFASNGVTYIVSPNPAAGAIVKASLLACEGNGYVQVDWLGSGVYRSKVVTGGVACPLPTPPGGGQGQGSTPTAPLITVDNAGPYVEAESSTNVNATAVTYGSAFHGTGWVQGYSSGGYTQWASPASSLGEAFRTYLFHMTNPFASAPLGTQAWTFTRDGVTPYTITVPWTPSPGGDWTNWSKAVDVIYQAKGTGSDTAAHTLRMTRNAGGSGSNLDYMREAKAKP